MVSLSITNSNLIDLSANFRKRWRMVGGPFCKRVKSSLAKNKHTLKEESVGPQGSYKLVFECEEEFLGKRNIVIDVLYLSHK